MFFFIPIGSEEGVRKWPYLTIGLIVFNTLIFIFSSTVLRAQERELVRLQEQLQDIETEYYYRLLEYDPNSLNKITLDEIHEIFAENDYIPEGTEDYQNWHRLYEAYKVKQNNLVFSKWGFTPRRFDFFKLLSYMFIHANFFHLLFNMLFLWMVGCNIEDTWSWKVFLGLYLISGIVACLLHSAVFPKSTVPLVGASGAIAGIMGAFMIRHYNTKIRFAYFFWLIFVPPIFGTFAIYAGIALPLWFIMQIISAQWSVEVGTAYYAHIGGFVFGAGVGLIMKFFGIEKKYVAPMVEDSFEKLKTSVKMKEANKKMDINDIAGAMPLLLTILGEEPNNYDAPLMLARIYHDKNHFNDAIVMYNKALDIILASGETDMATSLHEELVEKKLLDKIDERNLYNLGALLERRKKYEDAVRVFGIYIKIYPAGKVRAKALNRVYTIFKDHLDNKKMAQKALSFLKEEYPDFLIQD